MSEDFFEGYLEQAERVRELCRVDCRIYSIPEKSFHCGAPSFCANLCPLSAEGKCTYENTHLYGCYEAERWNSSYTYYCPAGLIFSACAILNGDGHIEGGAVTGPVIMSNSSDLSECALTLPEHLLTILPLLSTKKVRYLGNTVHDLCCYSSFADNPFAGEDEQSQRERHNIMYYVSDLYEKGEEKAYPIQYEKQLQTLVSAGDKDGAQSLLNTLLGHIYFSSGGDSTALKARIVELVVVLSRATIDAGADIHQIFWLNAKYLNEIERLDDMEKISRLLTNVIHRFISCVFDFDNIKHVDVIYKAIDYIKEHYCEKISLDKVADYVHLSKSYLSRIFKEELNCTFTSYTNKLRIEKSKAYLLNDDLSLADIAMLTGFDDQSYFTKVFKKTMGISPGKFRETRGAVQHKENRN